MRPYTTCYMAASIDGRIDCAMTEIIGGDEYYETLEAIDADIEINGRVTSEMHFATAEKYEPEAGYSPIGKTEWKVNKRSGKYHVVMDTNGTLQYDSDTISGIPALIIVSEKASRSYTEYLDSKGISWIAAGKDSIDLECAMTILHDRFGVRKAVVTGGGHLNGSFLQHGLIDEVIIQFNPGIDGRKGMTSVFDGIEDSSFGPVKLKLTAIRKFENGTVELTYKL